MRVYLPLHRNAQNSEIWHSRGFPKYFDFLPKLDMYLVSDVTCSSMYAATSLQNFCPLLRLSSEGERANMACVFKCKAGYSPVYFHLSRGDKNSVHCKENFTGRGKMSEVKRNFLIRSFSFY